MKATLIEPVGSQFRTKPWPKNVRQDFIDKLEPGEYFIRYRIADDTVELVQRISAEKYGHIIEYQP